MKDRERTHENDVALANRSSVLTSFAELGARLGTAQAGIRGDGDIITTIESEILPRLMLTFQDYTPADHPAIQEVDRLAFIKILLNDSSDDLSNFIAVLSARGVPIKHIFADLLSTTARRLGEMWERDEADFTDVTLGLCRLHEVLRHNSVIGDAAFVRPDPGAPSILLAASGGSQHVFGLLMVAEFFRRDGWRVWSEPGADVAALCEIVKTHDIQLVGLSVFSAVLKETTAGEIKALRASARNEDLRIFVGGAAILEEPELAMEMGADGFALDGAAAPKIGRELLAQNAKGC